MGYYTKFTMSVLDAKTKENIPVELEKEIAEKINSQFFQDWINPENIKESEYPLDEVFCYETYKWYTCEEDMSEFSKSYPDLIFIIDGQGEEYEDLWQAVIRNGRYVKDYAEIHLPDVSLNDFLDK